MCAGSVGCIGVALELIIICGMEVAGRVIEQSMFFDICRLLYVNT